MSTRYTHARNMKKGMGVKASQDKLNAIRNEAHAAGARRVTRIIYNGLVQEIFIS